MILVYDTETTGLPNFKARSADPAQPHLVQIALVNCTDAGVEIDSWCRMIRPNGWIISPEVTAIHGISHEQAMDEGIDEMEAAGTFMVFQARASLRVAHNESFDRRIMRIAMVRTGFQPDFIKAIEDRQSFCTCVAAKPIVNLPPHDALVDARACARIYAAIKAMGGTNA